MPIYLDRNCRLKHSFIIKYHSRDTLKSALLHGLFIFNRHLFPQCPTVKVSSESVNIKPNPRIVPAFAPITLCRVHGLGNPICPEKNYYYRKIIQAWGEILPEVYERGYWFNLAGPGLPFIMVHRIRTQIPAGHELGITGWRVETINHWGSEAPSPYIAAKLMWDHTADVDALLQDFYEKFFGPAATPMGRYITAMDAALRDADYHTGSSWDMPWLYPAQMRQKARALLDEAQGLAGDGIYGQRVGGLRLTFEYLEAFIEMLQRRTVHDWVGAKAALDRTQVLREEMNAFDPPMANPNPKAKHPPRTEKSETNNP